MNPKYNPNNYRKIPPFALLSGENFLTNTFTSSLLLVRWWAVKGGEKGELGGIIRVIVSTPLGDFEPIEYRLKIDPQRKQYIKFLSILNDGNEYKLEVIQDDRLKSTLSISEYMPTYPLDNTASDSPADIAMQASLISLQASGAAQLTALQTIQSQTNDSRPSSISSSNPTVQSATIVTVVSKNEKTKGVQIINTGGQNVKLWIQDTALPGATTYNDLTFDMELKPNSVWEVPAELVRANIYALAKTASSTLSVTVSAYN